MARRRHALVIDVPVMGGAPFDRRTARLHGISQRCLERLLAEGVVRQPLRGIYVDAAQADTGSLRAACAARVLPAGAAVSRAMAAWMWGVDMRGPERMTSPVAMECTVAAGQEPVARPGMRCHVAALSPDEIDDVHGVPCTTPLRTALDLLRFSAPHLGLGAADALAFRGLIAVEELVTEVERWRGRRGVIQARYLAPLVEPLTESFGESWLRLRIMDAGFPRPTAQIPIVDRHDRLIYRLDLGWEALRTAVEFDGEEFHSTEAARHLDGVRRDRLEREFGWIVVPATRGDVLGRSMRLERAVGELLGVEPQIYSRRW
jgi:hypothetical protein